MRELRVAARSGSKSAATDLMCVRGLRSRDLARVALAEEAAVHGAVSATAAELVDFGYGSALLYAHAYRGPFFCLYLQSVVAAIQASTSFGFMPLSANIGRLTMHDLAARRGAGRETKQLVPFPGTEADV